MKYKFKTELREVPFVSYNSLPNVDYLIAETQQQR